MSDTTPNPQDRLLVRPEDAARMLSLGRGTVYGMIASGELPAVRLGRAVRVPMDALRRWIDEQTQRGGRAA